MAPKEKKGGSTKQTTLKGFFSKPAQQIPNSSAVPPSSEVATPQVKTLHADTIESSSVPSSASKTASSQSIGGGGHDRTPATSLPNVSSPIAIDEDEDDGVEVVLTTGYRKRKLVVDEPSDEEVPRTVNAFAERLVGSQKDNASKRPAAKKSRASVILSDEEDGAETSRSEATSIHDTSSPRASSVLMDSEDDMPARARRANVKSLAARRAAGTGRSDKSSSGVSSGYDSDEFIAADDDDSHPRVRSKPKTKASKDVSSQPSVQGSSNSFLTAAERRAQSKKEEKKANETTYTFLQTRRDKDGHLPDHPDFDPRTLYIPKSAWSTFTPFERQFWEIKQNHYDTVLFFQKGKFFELYEDDAEIGHTQFDLKLTDRVKMKMVGVPEASFDFWAAKFLAKGYKVGKVDQSETQLGAEMRAAAEKKTGKAGSGGEKIVRRELGKILTNGTLVDAHMLHDEQAGHLVSIKEDSDTENSFGLCILDASTGEFNMSTFVDDVCGTKLETVMRQLRPKEILFTKGNLSVATNRLLKSLLSDSCIWSPMSKSEGLLYDDTITALNELYPAPEDEMSDEGLSSAIPEAIRSVVDSRVAIESLGAMVWYLRTLNLDKSMLTMKNFCIYDPMRKGRGLILDGQTLSHIEVLRNSEGTDEGSLLKLLSNCITPFGKRLFRIWLCMPLRDVKAINDRLDAVDDLMDNPAFEDDFTSLAKGLPDLERLVARIHAGSCKPKDFLKVLACFRLLSEGLTSLADVSGKFNSRSVASLLRGAPDLEPYVKNIESLFETPDADADDLVPEPGKHEEYDEVQNEIAELDKQFKAELKKLKSSVHPDLVYWHSSIGTKDVYLVEASSSFKPPSNWTKHSGTKNKTKWLVPLLQPMIRQFKEAQETKKGIVKDFKLRVYSDFDVDRAVWLQAVKVMAELDCLFSLAKSSSSMGQPSCRPEFVEFDEAFIDFEELRHPAIAARDSFIPNDIKLGGESERVMLLTGPNMGGKSTAMRMTAAGVIMAQLGMYVPARRAKLAPVDAILTRMGAYDNMFSNASTFKVEMDECCKILREASPRSLVILDELGRGTSTFDGMAIAGAVLHQLATHVLPLCCFATHYSSLTDDYDYHPNIRNMHMGTVMDEDERKLVFTYKLTRGAAESSFGTHVASLAGVSSDVVKRAEQISTDFAKQFSARLEAKRSISSRIPLVTQADFAFICKVALGTEPTDKIHLSKVLNSLSASTKASLARVVVQS